MAPEGNQYAVGNEGGRPTKYKEEYAEQAYKLCLLGFTHEDLADFFEVNKDTITEWMNAHNEFSVSVKAGKANADAEVAQKLFKRAIGYKYDEVVYEKVNIDVDKVEETTDDEIKMEVYKKKLTVKEVVPDTTAQIFWLKNRQPDKWREKTENLNKNFNYNSTEMTPEELKKYDQQLESEV